MPLWGKTTTDESKPKWLDNVNKNGLAEDCFATEAGWVLRHYKGTDKNTAVAAGDYWDEVLVAIGGLAGGASTTAGLGAATITGVFFEQESLAQGATGTVVVVYNELVDVAVSNPTLVVTGSVTGAVTATYARGTGLNRLEFDFTVPSATETLSIGAGSITLAGSSTIKDKGAQNADLTIAAGDVRGAGGSGTDKTLSIA
tara:strand:+ start:923 stop:1522 length:600 start_codon:yes stop_codon:yes gene_type:complete